MNIKKKSQKKYARLVRYIMKQYDLPLKALAFELGVSIETVRRWQRGDVNPSPLGRRALEDLKINLDEGG